MANVGVIGAGSWGTALSVLLHDNGHQVTIWSIDPEEVKMLAEEREHKKKLPGVKLSEDMVITGNLEAAVKKMFLDLRFRLRLHERLRKRWLRISWRDRSLWTWQRESRRIRF